MKLPHNCKVVLNVVRFISVAAPGQGAELPAATGMTWRIPRDDVWQFANGEGLKRQNQKQHALII